MPTPTTEPKNLFTGETWAWSKDLPDYPATDGWILKYALANAAARINLTAAAAGSSHTINALAATTAGYAAGTYSWQAYVERGAERFIVDRGTVKVETGLVDEASTPTDLRSQAEQAYDTALAALKQYTDTNGTVDEYEVDTGTGKRRVKYRSADELQRLVHFWAERVQAERIAAKRRQGKRLAGKILTRFGQ